MRVAIVSPYPFNSNKINGGVEASTVYLIEGLKKIKAKDLDIHIVTCRSDVTRRESVVVDGLTIHYLSSSRHFGNITLGYLDKRRIRDKIRELKPDIVHFQNQTNYAYIWTKPHCPTVTSVHGVVYKEALFSAGALNRIRRFPRVFLEKISLKNNKHIIYASEYSKNMMQHLTKARFYFTPYSVSNRYFNIENTEIPNRILCAASISRLKNQLDLVRAVNALKKEIPRIELHMAGEIKDRGYFRDIMNYIKKHRLEENVKYLGCLSEERLLKEYGDSCVFSLSTLQDNSPHVIHQAMAAGKAVVATKVGGIPNLVKDGVTGFLVDCRDIRNMSKKIKTLLCDKDLRDNFGRHARQKATRLFRTEIVAKKTYEVYKKILETRHKKKLLFVIPSLMGGGAERAAVNLINYLDKDKYDILLTLFESHSDHIKDLRSDVKILCLNKKNRWDFFRLISSLRHLMLNYRPDVVISFLHYTNILVVLASLFLKHRFKLLLNEQNYPGEYLLRAEKRYLKKRLIKFAYKKADKVIAVSYGIKLFLEKEFGIKPERIKTIYNPVSLETIRNKSKESVEHPFFRKKNAEVFIAAGRLVEQKRFDRLLQAFSIVKNKQKEVYLIILGKGVLEDRLKRLTFELGISESVEFVGFKSNPYAWISKGDIFLLSSEWEGLPTVILEAMACGIPVISTNCNSGPSEIITKGKNGLLVSNGNIEELADAILSLLRNKELKEKISAYGRERVRDFRAEKIVSKYEELFQEVG